MRATALLGLKRDMKGPFCDTQMLSGGWTPHCGPGSRFATDPAHAWFSDPGSRWVRLTGPWARATRLSTLVRPFEATDQPRPALSITGKWWNTSDVSAPNAWCTG